MTTTRIAASPQALRRTEQRAVQAARHAADYRNLPPPLDVFGARLRAARIRFTVIGQSIKLQPSKNEPWRIDQMLDRAWAIWQGTKDAGKAG